MVHRGFREDRWRDLGSLCGFARLFFVLLNSFRENDLWDWSFAFWHVCLQGELHYSLLVETSSAWVQLCIFADLSMPVLKVDFDRWSIVHMCHTVCSWGGPEEFRQLSFGRFFRQGFQSTLQHDWVGNLMGLSYVGHFGRTLIDTGCSCLEVVLRQLLNNDQLVGLFVFYG